MQPSRVFFYHMVIKYLVNKAKLSGRLARWMLLLEEFDYTVKYKLGRMHLHADHLSRLLEEMGTSPKDDRFIDDNLFLVTSNPDWYAGIVEFRSLKDFMLSGPKRLEGRLE